MQGIPDSLLKLATFSESILDQHGYLAKPSSHGNPSTTSPGRYPHPATLATQEEFRYLATPSSLHLGPTQGGSQQHCLSIHLGPAKVASHTQTESSRETQNCEKSEQPYYTRKKERSFVFFCDHLIAHCHKPLGMKNNLI